MKLPPYFMVFDVESIGLHGEAFAVGWVVIDRKGVYLDQDWAACSPTKASGTPADHKWVNENTDVHPSRRSPRETRDCFWAAWSKWKLKDAVLVADCAWPVEARFLAACIDDDRVDRRWSGPYPLHEIASFALAAGYDPLRTEDRHPEDWPAHHPLCDARHSARQLIHYLDVIERRETKP